MQAQSGEAPTFIAKRLGGVNPEAIEGQVCGEATLTDARWMNGLIVLDTLRDTGQIDGLSILVITGSITPASVLREKGAQGVLRKPFTRAELCEAVEAVAGHGARTPPGYRGTSR
jgi:DNA-binding NarL/FixJ family response regulator